MFTTYAGLALALLKFVNNLMNFVDREQMMKAGADAEIAKVSAAVLQKTQAGKAMMEKINAMDDKTVDSGLTDLEPK